MESTFLRLNKHWNEGKYKSLHTRSLVGKLLKRKSLPHIQILTGIRRSGKSTIFRLMINDLLAEGVNPKEIFLLNVDEPIFTPLWNNASDIYKVIEIAEKLTSVKVKYLFLDEIQQIKNWELFAKGAYDTKQFNKIYITGSNSDLLQNKFATLLSGRYFADTVRPFSFKEILNLHNFQDKLSLLSRKVEVLRLLDQYMEWGSFPEIILNDLDAEVKAELLKSYYESIVLKDCIVYNQVRDAGLFHRLLHYALSNITSLFFYSSIGKAIKSNENTTRSYLSYAVQSYVIADISNFSFSLKEENRPQHKVYAIDNGLTNVVGFSFSPRNGILLENLVYNELVNNGYTEITFARKSGECDFIARKDDEYHAFQVCYELTSQNQDREVAGLRSLANTIQLATQTIITYNQSSVIDDIRVVPFWELFGI